MERHDAIEQLNRLVGRDLVELAHGYGVTIWKGDKINKGWAGHTIERFLGLALNSSRSPNFGSWELKVVPIRVLPDGRLRVKETMAITMIDPVEVAAKSFHDSHLFQKLQRMVVVGRVFESKAETRSLCHVATRFDLGDKELHDQVEADYRVVREVIRTKGFDYLTGAMGVMVQPRTKGPGHGSTSRAFYARSGMVARILGL
jgi:DNA mismatch repair protein MutH